MLTSGNDERFQEYIKKATCIAVVNLNDGLLEIWNNF